MMNLDPRFCCKSLGFGDGRSTVYNGAVPFGGRKILPDTVIFRIGARPGVSPIFEGRLGENGTIKWTRVSTRGPADMSGVWHPQAGYWQFDTGKTPLSTEEEITVEYQWQPHHLHGAEIMVRLNNEERFIPIEDLQNALHQYLGSD